ncbi:hypothetical protein RvY_13326 [Ramazzottius varieornatus]|uniref:Uncharacterized protein n=1 Tax=Ramazzottius varieornatus TaxID=947166 RepID=A0A1D1VPN2_RAMVA|nr:hypothetical protein RvY_13326 [Ramazzottius varieornatus]
MMYFRKYAKTTILDSSEDEDTVEEPSLEVKTKKARERLEKLTPKAGTKGQITRVARMLELDTLNMFVSPSAGQKRSLKEAMGELGGRGGSSGSGGSQEDRTGGPKNKVQKPSSKRITDIEQSDDE